MSSGDSVCYGYVEVPFVVVFLVVKFSIVIELS